ncbi:acetyltransferase [Paraglaciecola polaris]|uniref:Sialic acid biosynthesis protein NeuD n=1 Tax=Paraglaciecola polaris LMG 21857 TaxID=1129793 RepID=K7ADP5_9ALTE|nr:acetyltransferase [Paraglaciecola polaris]GAC33440.1 sialic acid biosynthesis protein NeuD [Paraglaciecola polaris LMG 21857]
MSNGVLLIGGGGHASVLLEILIEQRINIVGYVSPYAATNQKLFSDVNWFKCDEDVLQFDKSTIELVNGIGSLPGCTLRADFYYKYKELGYSFATLVSKKADVSAYAYLGEGTQVMRGAIIQTGASVGYNSIVNSGSIVDHDCSIGSNNHVAPGATISGQVTSKANVHFGTGSSVIQSINVNENVVIGAGTIITKDVDKNTICYPARIFKKVIV